MKRIVIFLMLCSLTHNTSFGQRDISGIYSTVAQRIIITNDSLVLERIGQPGVPSWIEAKTTFNWADENFIEINSTAPYVLLREGIKIERFMDATIADSLKLSFSFPNYTTPLKVSVFADKNYNLTYSEDNKEILVPRPKISYGHIIISIENPVCFSELDGLFYGFRHVSLVCPIDKSVNRFAIEIPVIDYSFFQKYYVKGEYAKVSKNSITWKGEIFVKKK